MRLTLLLAALMILNGCGVFWRARTTPPPPGPTPVRIPDQVSSVDPAPPPKNLPAPPAIGTVSVDTKATTTEAVGLPPTPTGDPPLEAPEKQRPVRRATGASPPVVTPPAAAESQVYEAPPYRLGELRTAEEKDRLKRQTEQFIEQCTAALTATEGRVLTPTQSDLVNRVRTFAQQARDTIDKDPSEARNFAAKGRTFAEALLAELK